MKTRLSTLIPDLNVKQNMASTITTSTATGTIIAMTVKLPSGNADEENIMTAIERNALTPKKYHAVAGRNQKVRNEIYLKQIVLCYSFY